MKMRKLAGFLLMATLGVSMFAGCGNSAASEESSSEDKVLTMMMCATPTDPSTKTFQEIADEYSETNDLGYEVEVQYYENEQFKTKLTTLMAANNVPDIFQTFELAYLKPFVEGGKVYEVGEALNKDLEWKDTFTEGVFDPVTYDGKIYSIPTEKSVAVMFYNKKIFKDNNVEVPTTYDDFLNVCETLKNNGVTPMTLSVTDAWIPAQFVQQLSTGIGGMKLYNGVLDGTVKWNNESHVEAALEAQKMIDKGYFKENFMGLSTEESQKTFKEGGAAMYYMGSWDVPNLLDEETSSIKDDVGAFVMPAKNNENSNIPVASLNTCLSISENSKNKEAAVDFLKFFTSQQNQEKMLYRLGRIPAIELDYDTAKVSGVADDILKISESSVGLTPWYDRAFGAGEGTEFNNKCQSIFGGKDPVSQFNDLEKFAQDNKNR
ncbi:raffinose/stachyose/melibiose transport system substrate-binding protein [Clostridium neonatale]|uniref:ABC transporter substrate-binding protein n=1 Tax=Clostridium neonatale TaxID=137838 RepID=UPI00291C317E|nr:extracellular solute-binding protein [Clostridium neonatale]CAI3665492.1 raffinose/stachyose/melibiose transport system substrate-binding protein [Clostridium neonatale]